MLPVTAGERAGMLAAMNDGRLPNQSVLRMSDRLSHTLYQVVPGVHNLRGPQQSGQRRDVTTTASGGALELLGVLKTSGVITFEVIYADAHEDLLGASRDQTLERFELVFPPEVATSLHFWALVSLAFGARLPGVIWAQVRLDVSGEVEYG